MVNYSQKIYVTSPFLPPIEEFQSYIEKIWKNKWLTNNGPFHQELEQKLASFLGVKHVALFNNGTLALLVALKALEVTGEVITTPFTFVATAHSLVWNGLTPVFADIDPIYGNLDASVVEKAITPKTTAMMPVHVYGNPCDVIAFDKLAKKYRLKLIYDAAHAFGVKVGSKNIMQFGDLSVMSFHATKIINTFEGGAIACHSDEMKEKIDHLKNFGFDGETTIIDIGINAKMNEISAAMGIIQLKYLSNVIKEREEIANIYFQELENIKGIRVLKAMSGVEYNYAYFPVFIDEIFYGLCRDDLYEKLKQNNIFGRRYFYPLISWLDTYRSLPSSNADNLSNAEKIAKQVICLPIYPGLSKENILHICDIIKDLSLSC